MARALTGLFALLRLLLLMDVRLEWLLTLRCWTLDPVQVRYMQFTFVRLLEQLRVCVDATTYPPNWATFNTGLRTSTGDYLFILFTANVHRRVNNPATAKSFPPFVATLDSVRPESDPCWDSIRGKLPRPATYFSPRDPRVMFDPTANFVFVSCWARSSTTPSTWPKLTVFVLSRVCQNVGSWNIGNSYGRFVTAGLVPPCPPDQDVDEEVLKSLVASVKQALARVRARLQCDYCLALPQFYYNKTNVSGQAGTAGLCLCRRGQVSVVTLLCLPTFAVYCGKLQFLLPLVFSERIDAPPSLALAVSVKNTPSGAMQYQASTFLTLSMAYTNFRLVQRSPFSWVTLCNLPQEKRERLFQLLDSETQSKPCTTRSDGDASSHTDARRRSETAVADEELGAGAGTANPGDVARHGEGETCSNGADASDANTGAEGQHKVVHSTSSDESAKMWSMLPSMLLASTSLEDSDNDADGDVDGAVGDEGEGEDHGDDQGDTITAMTMEWNMVLDAAGIGSTCDTTCATADDGYASTISTASSSSLVDLPGSKRLVSLSTSSENGEKQFMPGSALLLGGRQHRSILIGGSTATGRGETADAGQGVRTAAMPASSQLSAPALSSGSLLSVTSPHVSVASSTMSLPNSATTTPVLATKAGVPPSGGIAAAHTGRRSSAGSVSTGATTAPSPPPLPASEPPPRHPLPPLSLAPPPPIPAGGDSIHIAAALSTVGGKLVLIPPPPPPPGPAVSHMRPPMDVGNVHAGVGAGVGAGPGGGGARSAHGRRPHPHHPASVQPPSGASRGGGGGTHYATNAGSVAAVGHASHPHPHPHPHPAHSHAHVASHGNYGNYGNGLHHGGRQIGGYVSSYSPSGATTSPPLMDMGGTLNMGAGAGAGVAAGVGAGAGAGAGAGVGLSMSMGGALPPPHVTAGHHHRQSQHQHTHTHQHQQRQLQQRQLQHQQHPHQHQLSSHAAAVLQVQQQAQPRTRHHSQQQRAPPQYMHASSSSTEYSQRSPSSAGGYLSSRPTHRVPSPSAGRASPQLEYYMPPAASATVGGDAWYPSNTTPRLSMPPHATPRAPVGGPAPPTHLAGPQTGAAYGAGTAPSAPTHVYNAGRPAPGLTLANGHVHGHAEYKYVSDGAPVYVWCL